jgi:arylsulfatase A-like enzyme
MLSAAGCLAAAIAGQLAVDSSATGAREVIARSRAGALTRLYLLPRFTTSIPFASEPVDCPTTLPLVDTELAWTTPEARRNVILITVDALRKDVVGTRHDGRAVTPALDEWMETGLSFENATTPYPATLFAIGAAFTGLTPAELYLHPGLPETIFTRSSAHVDEQMAVLPNVGWFRLPIVSELLARDVDIEFAPSDTAATNAMMRKLRSARANEKSVMAWIHYYAPHDPYRRHPSFPMDGGRRGAYLSEVAYFDRELGRLMSYLTRDGWLDDSLVVFFSDHGEALGEGSYWGHHVYLNGWMIDVPVVLWHADLAPDKPLVGIGLADIAPTVLHFLGLPRPSDTAGDSLFALDRHDAGRPTFAQAFPVRGRALFDRFQLGSLEEDAIRARFEEINTKSEGYEPKTAITMGSTRLIHHRAADTFMMFDRMADPDERTDILASQPARAEALQERLASWQRQQRRRTECRLRLQHFSSDEPQQPKRPRQP